MSPFHTKQALSSLFKSSFLQTCLCDGMVPSPTSAWDAHSHLWAGGTEHVTQSMWPSSGQVLSSDQTGQTLPSCSCAGTVNKCALGGLSEPGYL